MSEKPLPPWRVALAMLGVILLFGGLLTKEFFDLIFARGMPVLHHVNEFTKLGLLAQAAALAGTVFALFGRGWLRLLTLALGIWEIVKFQAMTTFA